MGAYRELKAYKGFNKKINALISAFEKFDEDLQKKTETVALYFDSLKVSLASYYKADELGNYKSLNVDDINKIKSAYEMALSALMGLKNGFSEKYPDNRNIRYINDIERALKDDMSITDKLNVRDNLSLPESAYKFNKEIKKNDYVNGNFKWPGFYEYSRIYASDKSRTREDILEEFIKKTPKQVEETYKKAVDNTPRLYEYVNISKVVPPNIRNTSDTGKIEEFLAANLNNLSYPQQVRLKKQIEAANKVKEINDSANIAMNNNEEIGVKPEVVSKRPDHAEIKIRQPQHQTSGQGCWSCSGQMLVASRGINVTQQDIRGYRPNLTDDDVVLEDDQTDYSYNYDGVKNLLEMGDSVLSFAPNCMIHELSIGKYTADAEKKGISKEKYINDTAEFMRKHILHAIKVDHSPVAFLTPGHYVTITGIDGDVISYKDSAATHGHSANHTFTMSISQFLKREYAKSKDDPRQLGQFQFSWISDIKLSKDSKTIYGVPSVYAGVDEDGTIKLPPEDIGQNAAAEVANFGKKENGARIYRLSGDERANIEAGYDPYKNEGVEFVEKVYMPKKVNLTYLKNMAANRSDDEEEILKEANKNIYKIPEDKEAARKALDDFRNKIEPIKEDEEELIMGIEVQINEVAEKIGFKTIRDMARTLYNDLNRHQHFYTINKKPEYGYLLDDLMEVANYANDGMQSAVAGDNKFKPENAAEMVKTIDRAIRNARRYLEKKCREFEADPRRKNDTGKKTEQNRIKAVLDAYETLLNYRAGIDEVFYNKKTDMIEAADREKLVRGYRRKLVSEYNYKKSLHEKSYKNSIPIPDSIIRPLERMDAIWGRNTEMLKEFENPNYFRNISELNEKTLQVKEINSFRKIKSYESDMIGIGEGGKNDMLTNKDFAALACAASTMKSIFVKCRKKSKLRYPDFVPANTEFINYGHMFCSTSTGLTMPHEMTTYVEAINASKDIVKDAMNQYKWGNLTPLAKIIKEGITNIVRTARVDLIEPNANQLYLGEMCTRMLNMMNRDNKLMKEVLNQGLLAEDIKYVDTMKEYGLSVAMANDYESQCLGAFDYDGKNIKEWTHDEKIEKYTDMMLSELYKGIKDTIEGAVERNPDFIRETQEFSDKCDAEKRRIQKQIIATFEKELISENEANALYRNYTKRVKQANAVEDPEFKETKLETAETEFVMAIGAYNLKISPQMMDYEKKILEKYKPQLDQMNEDLKAEKKKTLNKKEQLKECLKLEKEYVNRYKVADTEEEKEQYNKEFREFEKYEKYSASVRKIDEMLGEFAGAKGDLIYRKVQYANLMRVKYMPKDTIMDEISKHTNVEGLRKRVRNYIVSNGFDKYGMKEFVHKVYMTSSPESVHYLKNFSNVLTQWEVEQEGLKAQNKQMNAANNKQADNVKNKAQNNGPAHVIGNVNMRKNSVKVKGNNAVNNNTNKTRSKSTVIKGKGPKI